jgi:hypothetical protein
MKHQHLNFKSAEFLVASCSLQKGNASLARNQQQIRQARSHKMLRNLNLLHYKSIYIQVHHARRCTNVLSIWIQDSKKLATRVLAVLVSTSSFSTSTSTTSTDSRPINFNPRMGHTKTSFVQQESFLKKSVNPKCVAPVSPSQQLKQHRCSVLIPVMGKAVQKQQNKLFGKIMCCSCMGGQMILSFLGSNVLRGRSAWPGRRWARWWTRRG